MATIGWNNYTNEQKEEMLNHIFYYYNHAIITWQEFEDFKTLIDKNADKVFYGLVGLFGSENSAPTVLVSLMRNKAIEQLFSVYDNLPEESKKNIRDYGDMLLEKEFEITLKKPEPNIPMSTEEIITQVSKIITKK